jgi:hypothetical protein
MRIQGRILRASNLAERRVLLALGVDHHNFKVSRRLNPFIVARHVKKLAAGRGDLPALKALLRKTHVPAPVLPDSTTEPRTDGEQHAA